MEGLFFALDPIWWIMPVHLSSVLIPLSGGVLFALYLWYRSRGVRGRRQLVNTPESYEFHPIDDNDPSYAEKTLVEIRRYLSYYHPGVHSWAHIPSDIGKYSIDSTLMAIIEQLEHSEYTNTHLAPETRAILHRELIKKLKIG